MTTLHKKSYGAWAGFPSGHAPDLTRCCEEVTYYIGGWPKHKQCTRKCGHGPMGAYCKQHDPVAVKERQEKANADYRAKANAERYKWYGPTFFKALEEIAAGHNDARGLAQEVIAKFKEGER